MALSEGQWQAMTELGAVGSADGEPGWVTPGAVTDDAVFWTLERQGLCEMADPATLATLGTGDCPAWAARLTSDGHDLLAYRPVPEIPSVKWQAKQADGAYEQVELQPAEMTMVRRYAKVAPRLSRPPAEGLGDAVTEAFWEAESKRWCLQVTKAQRESIARAFFLERFTGTTAAANRFGRAYGVSYRPAR